VRGSTKGWGAALFVFGVLVTVGCAALLGIDDVHEADGGSTNAAGGASTITATGMVGSGGAASSSASGTGGSSASCVPGMTYFHICDAGTCIASEDTCQNDGGGFLYGTCNIYNCGLLPDAGGDQRCDGKGNCCFGPTHYCNETSLPCCPGYACNFGAHACE
jgi:hypothetical protein